MGTKKVAGTPKNHVPKVLDFFRLRGYSVGIQW